eukprot:gene12466-16720_t
MKNKLLFLFIFLLVTIIHIECKIPSRGHNQKNVKQSNKTNIHEKSKIIKPEQDINSKKPKHVKTSKIKSRHVIIPVKKERLSAKAFRTFTTVSESIKQTVDIAKQSTEKIKRDMKSYFSSDFEALLLRMTAPHGQMIEESDIDRFLATTESFVRNMDLVSSSNPYRVTLRKIWAKVSENEGFTVLKSLYLLHTLLKFSQPEDVLIYKNLIVKMSKEFSKKSKSRYFHLNTFNNHILSSNTAIYHDFIKRYSTYVLSRAKAFTASFEEMKLINYGMRTEDICAQLLKACKVIDLALLCKPSTEEESEVSVSCLELVATDLLDLFHLYSIKLKWMLNEDEVSDIFSDWKEDEVKSILKYFTDFYNE